MRDKIRVVCYIHDKRNIQFCILFNHMPRSYEHIFINRKEYVILIVNHQIMQGNNELYIESDPVIILKGVNHE